MAAEDQDIPPLAEFQVSQGTHSQKDLVVQLARIELSGNPLQREGVLAPAEN